MQLDHVLVGEAVVAIDLLTFEGAGAPDPRELDLGGDVFVHARRDVLDRRSPRQHERTDRFGLLARLLRVDPDAKLAMTAIDYPPMQDPASFNLSEVKAKVDAMIKASTGR